MPVRSPELYDQFPLKLPSDIVFVPISRVPLIVRLDMPPTTPPSKVTDSIVIFCPVYALMVVLLAVKAVNIDPSKLK